MDQDVPTPTEYYNMVVHYVSSLAGASNTVTVPITVQVTAVNDDTTPSFTTNPTILLGEETAVGTTVRTYSGVDDDGPPHDIVKYEILRDHGILLVNTIAQLYGCT